MSGRFSEFQLHPSSGGTSPDEPFPFHVRSADLGELSREEILATTWDGTCLRIALDTGEWAPEPLVALTIDGAILAGSCLRSLSIGGGNPPLIGVATQAAWAGVWRSGSTTALKVEPRQQSPVNAVGLAPHAPLLAIGTGCYALSHDHRKAAVELWDISGAPQPMASTLLPDVAVDSLAWDPSAKHLLVLTGAASQAAGHLFILDGETLEVLHRASTSESASLAARFLDGSSEAVFVTQDAIVTVELGERVFRVRREIADAPIGSASISGNKRQVLLSTGELVRLSGHASHKIDVPLGCSGVLIRRGGGYAALSRNGQLRVWDEDSR